MSGRLIFAAEPLSFEFEGGAGDGEAFDRAGEFEGQYESGFAPFGQEFESSAASGALQCVPAQLKTPRPPRGLVLLPHFHLRKSLPKGEASGVPQCMEPAGMNPGFVDPAGDKLVTGASATGLHARLNELMTSKHKQRAQKISVALVDLTGPRLFAPDFAGWRSTVPVYGASLPKISALYPAHQLGFELRTLASHLKLTTKKALVDHVRGLWGKAGLTRKQQPNLDELFDDAEAAPSPVGVKLSAKLEKLISCTIGNCNWAASLLIDRVGLAYVGSVLWQSGLFHPKRGGLWLKGLYGLSCGGLCASDCCFPKHKVEKALLPVYAAPTSGPHSATALSAATYFTLMAQGRLGDDATSARIRNDLGGACTLFGRYTLACQNSGMPAKCGYWNGHYHDVALVESGCAGKVVRYAVALMTHNAFPSAEVGSAFQQFLRDADALVRQNN